MLKRISRRESAGAAAMSLLRVFGRTSNGLVSSLLYDEFTLRKLFHISRIVPET